MEHSRLAGRQLDSAIWQGGAILVTDGEQSFGGLLREHRLAAGLTQAALAERASISTRGIQDLERGLSQPHRDTVLRLAEALELSANERTAFWSAVTPSPRRRALTVSAVPPAARPVGSSARHNLPEPLTSLIGRERELAALRGLLAGARLVTLSGAGGIGKTRLALQMAADLVDAYADGVWWVELAPLTNPALVPQRVASVVDLREQPGRPLTEALIEVLRPKHVLLVLDSCEHLIGACAQLTDALLSACPRLRIVATTREPLGILGEAIWQVPSLSTPDPHQPASIEVVTQYEAVRLFIARAVMAQSTFAVTKQNAPAVADICRQLDGIPLAIELAAVRVKLLTAEQIAARLHERFRLLVGGSRTALPRHQTLRGAIDWSYQLLSDREQTLFNRLAVFAGGWTLKAAEAVCAAGAVAADEVLELLSHLVDKSLVVVQDERGAVARYRLLETLRQYALDRLAESGDAGEATLGQYNDYFLALGERAAPHLNGGPQFASWLRRLDHEQDNLRAALRWCVERGEVERGLRLGAAVSRYWFLRGSQSEGWEWLEALLRLTGGSARTAIRARALDGAGLLASQQGDSARAQDLHEESLAIWHDLGDQARISASLNNLGMLALRRGDFEAARAHLKEAIAMGRAAGDQVRVAIWLSNLGQLFQEQGDYSAARALFAESLATYREVEDTSGMASALSRQGYVALAQGDVTAARTLCDDSLALAREAGDATTLAWCCLDVALVRVREGEWAAARVLFVESLHMGGFLHAPRESLRLARCLAGLASVAAADGNPERAMCLFGAATAIRDASEPDTLASSGPPFDHASVERWEPLARSTLGERAAAAAYSAGLAFSLEEAIGSAC